MASDYRFSEIASLDLLTSPVTSNGNSYITHSLDDSSNPIMAIRNTDSIWRLNTHPRTVFTGIVATGGTTSAVASVPVTGVGVPSSGNYVLQFTSGGNAGACRILTGLTGSTVSWTTALHTTAAPTDTFEVYQSTASLIKNLEANASSGLIYSILLGD